MTPPELTAMQHSPWVLPRPAEIHCVLRDEAICCLSAPLRAARAKIHPKPPKKAAAGKLRARFTSQAPLTQHHRGSSCLKPRAAGNNLFFPVKTPPWHCPAHLPLPIPSLGVPAARYQMVFRIVLNVSLHFLGIFKCSCWSVFPSPCRALIYVARYHISLPCQKHAFGNDFRAAGHIFPPLFILHFIFINFFVGDAVKMKLWLEETTLIKPPPSLAKLEGSCHSHPQAAAQIGVSSP